MNRNELCVAITGATGLLGRTILLEFIKRNISDLSRLKLIIFGRSTNDAALSDRIHHIILNQAPTYCKTDAEGQDKLRSFCNTNISFFDWDLNSPIDPMDERIRKIKHKRIHFFFHAAALTDLRNSPNAESKIFTSNYLGTKNMFSIISHLQVDEFNYISTAYASGSISGNVYPNQSSGNFRNPYERYKRTTELMTKDYCHNIGIKYRCLRPSIICGQLIEEPIGYTNKFDVFYATVAYLHKLKSKAKIPKNEYFTTSLRLRFGKNGSLNIVPVDYAAKIIYEICMNDHASESCHIVNPVNTNHTVCFKSTLSALKINGIKMVSKMPSNLNLSEKAYYKYVGKVFDPYVNCGPLYFSTENINDILIKSEIQCPRISCNNFLKLLNFARDMGFRNRRT
ncbi:SDR family oxidoreductase [Fulvivirgaceae bacterium BMA10]|uniref:SDR family oxidoreductase n=1 Tax=Splendidivirga corallicola TaxID=3051826 RepID=A0ABT8KN24_9BACT|nr:SDR family oxidoreductase [Fulvivirgaceae bacterium BMA10]